VNIIIHIIWNGILLGVRHYEPDEAHPYFELRIYLLFIQLTIFVDKRK